METSQIWNQLRIKFTLLLQLQIRKTVSNQPGAKKKPAKHFKCNSYHFNCAINSFDLDLLSKRGDKRFARFSKAVGYVSQHPFKALLIAAIRSDSENDIWIWKQTIKNKNFCGRIRKILQTHQIPGSNVRLTASLDSKWWPVNKWQSWMRERKLKSSIKNTN